jgi:hypothetical protein
MRRVAGPDAALLYGETDAWQFHVAALAIVDPTGVDGFGPERVRNVFSRRVHRIPQLRWRLHDPTLWRDRRRRAGGVGGGSGADPVAQSRRGR